MRSTLACLALLFGLWPSLVPSQDVNERARRIQNSVLGIDGIMTPTLLAREPTGLPPR